MRKNHKVDIEYEIINSHTIKSTKIILIPNPDSFLLNQKLVIKSPLLIYSHSTFIHFVTNPLLHWK